eukprot:TRINITY_DN76832_c0_g1_i1.p1 TRINITY_DN76832_c0_g1~~TRINITY_DN76832_c0_g1_i1.p1  ORF type:complete len:243 (+),score=44.21 TRINITY_DN76832_c0_g1_i1:90-818(+)
MGSSKSAPRPVAEPLYVDRFKSGYYKKDNIDQYAKMITSSVGREAILSRHILDAASECVKDDGKIDAKEVREVILPKVQGARAEKSGLTCHERWSVRFALAEFDWDAEARHLIIESMRAMDLEDVCGKTITDASAKSKILQGPTLAELEEPPAKVAKGNGAATIAVDGMMLDAAFLRICAEGAENGVVDSVLAVKIFIAAASDGVLTRTERWTIRFLLSSYHFTQAAAGFIVEVLMKVPQTN